MTNWLREEVSCIAGVLYFGCARVFRFVCWCWYAPFSVVNTCGVFFEVRRRFLFLFVWFESGSHDG